MLKTGDLHSSSCSHLHRGTLIVDNLTAMRDVLSRSPLIPDVFHCSLTRVYITGIDQEGQLHPATASCSTRKVEWLIAFSQPVSWDYRQTILGLSILPSSYTINVLALSVVKKRLHSNIQRTRCHEINISSMRECLVEEAFITGLRV